MVSLVQSYDEEITEVFRQLTDALNDVSSVCNTAAAGYAPPPLAGPLSRTGRLKTCDTLIAKCKELASNIDVEANDVIPAQRQSWRDKVAEYRRRYLKAERDLADLKTKAGKADRDDLLSATNPNTKNGGANSSNNINNNLDDESLSQRADMAKNTSRLQEGTKTLNHAERILADTEQLGRDTEKELYRQRETLQSIHNTTREADAEVSDARRIANQMHKVMVQNKAMLVGIIALLAIMIIVIIWVKTTGGSSSSSGPSPPTVIVLPPPGVTAGGGSTGGSAGGGLDG